MKSENQPRQRGRRSGSGEVSIRELPVFWLLFERGPQTSPQIRADVSTFKSDGAFTSTMRRLRRMRLVSGERVRGQKPYTFWLSPEGVAVVERIRRRSAAVSPHKFYSQPAATDGSLPLPGTMAAQFRCPDESEMRLVLDQRGVTVEFKIVCQALCGWPDEASELVALNVEDADVTRNRLKGTVQMTGQLRVAVHRAIELRQAGPLFESPRGGYWTKEQFRKARHSPNRSQQCKLFLHAIDCKEFSFEELAAMPLSAADHVAARSGGQFAKVVKDAVVSALGRPLFRNAYAGRWTVKNVNESFRFHARDAGLDDNVQFPGSTKLRALLVESGAARAGDTDTTSGACSELVLYARDRAPEIGGVVQPFLSDTRDKVVRAVLTAGPRGLTKDQLVENSGCGDARKILTRLRDSSTAWASVIEFPGERGGGYRIRGHFAQNGHPPLSPH
jgi:hypothetical protein